MNEPRLDLRVRRTHKLLWEALVALLRERDFDAISVTEVCERAMVHRTTFYKHYEDKHGLLRHGINEELTALYREIAAGADVTSFPAAAPDHVAAILAHVKSRRPFYTVMLTGSASARFSELLAARLRDRQEQRTTGSRTDASVPLGLFARVNSAALVAMVTWWLENDCMIAPAEMSGYLASMLRNSSVA